MFSITENQTFIDFLYIYYIIWTENLQKFSFKFVLPHMYSHFWFLYVMYMMRK